MVPTPESLSSNLSEIRNVSVHDETRAPEPGIAKHHGSCAAEDANRRDPVAPVALGSKITERFAAAPALRPALVVGTVVNANALTQSAVIWIVIRIVVRIAVRSLSTVHSAAIAVRLVVAIS